MIGEDLDRAAEAAAARYALLLNAFRGLFADVVAGEGAPASAAVERLVDAAYAEASTWLETERVAMMGEVDLFGERGARAVDESLGLVPGGLSDPALMGLEEIAEGLEHAIRLQCERDVAVMRDAMRGIALRERFGGGTRGFGAFGGRGGAAARESALGRLSFEFIDRSGRRWPSVRHARTLWRMSLVAAHVETAVLRAGEIGIERLAVGHPDLSHGSHGEILDLGSPEADETWERLRTEVFHPNSHAWLEPAGEAA